jgi:hypothetical protein
MLPKILKRAQAGNPTPVVMGGYVDSTGHPSGKETLRPLQAITCPAPLSRVGTRS